MNGAFPLSLHLQAPLYNSWGRADRRTHSIVQRIEGIRVLRQDPLECLISFICSSNNNISRISLMLSKLRERFGQHIADVIFEDSSNISLHSFPTLDELLYVTEEVRHVPNVSCGWCKQQQQPHDYTITCSDFGCGLIIVIFYH